MPTGASRPDASILIVTVVLAAVGIGVQQMNRRTDRRANAVKDAAVTAATMPRADRTLEPTGGGNFLLTNKEKASAYEVHIDLGDTSGAFGNVLHHDAFSPGSVVGFGAEPDYNGKNNTCTVR